MINAPKFSYSPGDLSIKVEVKFADTDGKSQSGLIDNKEIKYLPNPPDIEANKDEFKHACTAASTKNGLINASSQSQFEGSCISFDNVLRNLWIKAQTKGLFRYELKNLPIKVLPGKYGFILQLNPDRAQKRRKPQEIASLKQPFNPEEFNFNKIKPEEILLQLQPWYSMIGKNALGDNNDDGNQEHLLLINVSPLDFGHVLLTPFRNKNNPQMVSPGGLKLAIELALLSRSCDFRVGFNSLCGFASVNHEHYHAYYLKHRLYLESAKLKLIRYPCYEIEDYPGPGFVFLLTAVDEKSVDEFIRNVLKLTTYFQDNDVAHNIFITRGSSNTPGQFDALRLFLWARSSSFGAKGCDAFNPALCELGGHFPCKNETAYETLTEEFIIQELGGICNDTYAKIRSIISDLL